MLNVNSRISLSRGSKKAIKHFYKRNGGKNAQGAWDKIKKSVKNEISKKLLYCHGIRCIYCEKYLDGVGHQIDHFLHKASYPQFTFTTVNLFYSCSFCNSSARKGEKPTMLIENSRYNNCSFSIVHPLYDNPDKEIKYKDVDRIDIDWDSCSQIGKDTIIFFGFDDLIMTNIRVKNSILSKQLPVQTEEEKKFILELIAYK